MSPGGGGRAAGGEWMVAWADLGALLHVASYTRTTT